MATKNLGRTAVEGGRTGHYKTRVKEIEGSFRTANRDFVSRAANDVEALDEELEPVRHPKSKKGNQTDKLRPVYSMLDSMVGRPWAKVYAEICKKFDGRTLAGRHVLYDHIIGVIDPHEHVISRYQANYFVDAKGIFQKRKYERPRYPRKFVPGHIAVKTAAWLDGRAVIRQGSKLYWGVACGCVYGTTHRIKLTYWLNGSDASAFHYGDPSPYSMTYPREYPFYNWRQDVELTRDEAEFFNSLPDWMRGDLTVIENGRKKHTRRKAA